MTGLTQFAERPDRFSPEAIAMFVSAWLLIDLLLLGVLIAVRKEFWQRSTV
jgi:hypothetical protein